jgi:head-tail adaptor
MIKAGELREKIDFERKTVTKLDNGDLASEWNPLLSTFAKVTEKSGGYSYETGTVNGRSRIEVMIRYRPEIFIKIGDRVKWRYFTWIVENSPVVDPLRTKITFMATMALDTSQRSEVPPNDVFPYVLPFELA